MLFTITAVIHNWLLFITKSRVPDQNGVSQAWYIVKIHHSGQKPSKYTCSLPNSCYLQLQFLAVIVEPYQLQLYFIFFSNRSILPICSLLYPLQPFLFFSFFYAITPDLFLVCVCFLHWNFPGNRVCFEGCFFFCPLLDWTSVSVRLCWICLLRIFLSITVGCSAGEFCLLLV